MGDEAENLLFEREHQLSHKPLEMDLLIIKMQNGIQLKKNIGKIFRKHNIIEYKSPKDYLSINDFYKVYGYACIYQADTKEMCEILPSDITLTMISNKFPRKMVNYLQKERGLAVHKQGQGIYYLEGDQFKIQVLVNKELSREENFWLNSLRDDLKSREEIEELIERYEGEKNNKWHSDVADTILRGNWESVKEAKSMCEALRELFREELEEEREIGQAKVIVQDNLESGASKEVIIKKLQKFVHIDREKAEQYYQQNLRELKG